jgi:hypothetical protein
LTDANSTTNKLAKYNLDTAKFNYGQLSIEAKQKADKVADDLKNGTMSRLQAQSAIDHAGDSAAANAADLAWKQSDKNPANAKVDTTQSFTIDDWGKVLDNEFLPKYDNTGAVTQPGVVGGPIREQRILNLGLSYDMTKALYLRYNIPMPK